jgi:hypothetical protein
VTHFRGKCRRQDSVHITADNANKYTCDVIKTLARKGHTNAWGLFAFPRSLINEEIHNNYVTQCYAFARTYSGKKYKILEPEIKSWQLGFWSVNGGSCALTDECKKYSSAFNQAYAYTPPSELLAHLSNNINEWSGVQFYKLVRGKKIPNTTSIHEGEYWDCTSKQVEEHWSSHAEIYCLNDFEWILENVPKNTKTINSVELAKKMGRIVPSQLQ